MLRLPPDVRTWIDGIGSSLIGGAATSASAWMGLTVGEKVGLAVPQLNLKALGAIMLSGALTNLFFYLKQSPLPTKTQTTKLTVTQETIDGKV